MRTSIVNINITNKWDVYIGIPSDFGNHFHVKTYGRDEAIEKYRKYFLDRVERDSKFRLKVERMRGKVMACFCKPGNCHGDVIVEYLEKENNEL